MKISTQKSVCFLFVLIVFCLPKLIAQTHSPTQGTYRTIFEMLREIPGLEVKTSNDKSGGTVIVRGMTSLRNQRPPLFVVNGVIYGGDITTINVQDVDEISVIKDAASASVYGAQGSFGVILITTKKTNAIVNNAVISSHSESAYTYFIQNKTKLKVIGMNDEIIVEGIIQKQVDSSLVFIKKKKELLVPIKSIKKVEMINE